MGRSPVYDVVNTYQPPLKPGFSQPVKDHTIFVKGRYGKFQVAWFRHYYDEGNALGMNPQFYVFDAANRWKYATDILWGAYESELGTKGFLSVDLSYTRHHQYPDTMFHKFDLDQYMTGCDRTFKGAATLKYDFTKNAQVIFGLDYENTRSIPAYANDHVLDYPYKYEGNAEQIIDQHLTLWENRVGLFAQMIAAPFSWVQVSAGLRFDYSSLNQDSFNPRLGLVFQPSKSTTIKFLMGTAFQAPSLFYKYEQFGVPSLVMIPNPQLENQELTTYEISLSQKVGNHCLFKLSGYYNRLKNLIERAPLPGERYNKYYDTYTPALQNTNIGRQVGKGFNLGVDLFFNNTLTGYCYYSFTDADFTIQEKNPVPRVSAHKVWLGFTYKGIGNVTISPRARWVGPVNTSVLNTQHPSPQKQPGYVQVDLYVRIWKLIPTTHFHLFVKIENLLDADIKHPGLFGQSGVYMPYVYQPGITARFGIEWEL